MIINDSLGDNSFCKWFSSLSCPQLLWLLYWIVVPHTVSIGFSLIMIWRAWLSVEVNSIHNERKSFRVKLRINLYCLFISLDSANILCCVWSRWTILQFVKYIISQMGFFFAHILSLINRKTINFEVVNLNH